MCATHIFLIVDFHIIREAKAFGSGFAYQVGQFFAFFGGRAQEAVIGRGVPYAYLKRVFEIHLVSIFLQSGLFVSFIDSYKGRSELCHRGFAFQFAVY